MRQPALAQDPFVSDHATEQMANEVRASLMSPVPYLPSKYFYDDRGSRLFERITRTDEYYQTRTEEALLASCAGNVVARVRPQELVELGGGVSRKMRLLLNAMRQSRMLRRCVLFDIHRGSLESSLGQLAREYPGLAARGIVGDFQDDVTALGPGRLASFLVLEAELQRVVAVALLVADLEHGARTELQDRHGGELAGLVVNLRHADF